MLLYFILGILFIYLIIPLLDMAIGILNAKTQYTTYKYAFKIYQIKKQMGLEEQDQEQGGKIPMGFATEAVGFSVQTPDEFQEDDE